MTILAVFSVETFYLTENIASQSFRMIAEIIHHQRWTFIRILFEDCQAKNVVCELSDHRKIKFTACCSRSLC